MSLVLNMVGGGGGISGNRAVLVARVHNGSTVTATKGGITLNPTMWVSESDPTQDIALFVFSSSQFDSVNPWTITATLGSQQYTGTILITDNKEYEIDLTGTLILYNAGDQCSIVTGGWAAYPYPVTTSYGFQAVDPTFESTYIQFSATSLKSCAASINNAINVAKYNTLKIEVTDAGHDYVVWGLRDTNTGTYDGTFVVRAATTASGGAYGKSIDISSLTGSYYFMFSAYVGAGGPSTNIRLSKVWLER